MEKSRSFPVRSRNNNGFEIGLRAGVGRSNSYSFNGPSHSFSSLKDLELKRKKRVASYNMFIMESKLKSTARNSFKWIKTKFTEIRYGM
ncbi:Protein of unknown function DUF3511 [Macleaya cordata]|uniref:Uncharacterized protein n=1 Tax=Macleaya cordata TaxID=56857 RepID=A0A200QFI7_MACCD|nr:Protein of unknown function DUF3511 [Macleaya cordata]